MAAEREPDYPSDSIAFLEVLWGEGYLSPGGPEEVRRALAGLEVAGRRVLDIGCGAGGVACTLAAEHGAAEVVGIDVEAPVLARARSHAADRGLTDRVTFRRVEPGPLPLPDDAFDLVFSKDAMLHIADKEALFREILRVLRPDGYLAASDWLVARDGPPSPAMARYLELEGPDFAMASPARYRRALAAAGFVEIALVDRNPWYREVARRELIDLQGRLYERAVAAGGKARVERNIATWRAMLTVLDNGEHRPHHLRARKPG